MTNNPPKPETVALTYKAILKETDKSRLIEFEDGTSFWCPKILSELVDSDVIIIPKWIQTKSPKVDSSANNTVNNTTTVPYNAPMLRGDIAIYTQDIVTTIIKYLKENGHPDVNVTPLVTIILTKGTEFANTFK